MKNIYCKKCGRLFDNFSEEWIGKNIECVKCGHIFLCEGVSTDNKAIARQEEIKLNGSKTKASCSSWVFGIGLVSTVLCYYLWIVQFLARMPGEAIIGASPIIVVFWIFVPPLMPMLVALLFIGVMEILKRISRRISRNHPS